MALEQIAANAPSQTYERINAAIRALILVQQQIRMLDFKQDAFDLLGLLQDVGDISSRSASNANAIAALQADLDADELVLAAANELLARLVKQRFDFLESPSRPGDSPASFVVVPSRSILAGDGRNVAEVSSGAVATGDSGRAIRLTGATVVAQRQPVPIEAGRVYRARYVVQRRANPSDPSNDSVVLGILWLDASLNIIAPTNDATIVEDMRDLMTASGRQERAVLFSRSQSPDAQFRAPSRARYARAYAQSYGLDGVTDVEVLGIEDVSLATILAPETADTVQRVGALESVNAGQRLGVLEANANAPNSITFPTKSDAASGTIPVTATTVALRGLTQAGDGGDGIYRRISGAAAAGADSFINQGVTFVRVFTSADVLGALLNSLPTTLPPVSGRAWLNGGVLAVS